MGWLEKEFILHERDENGKLLPIDCPVKELGGRVVTAIPVLRGETLKLFRNLKDAAYIENLPLAERLKKEEELTAMKYEIRTTSDVWRDYVVAHLVKPMITKKEIEDHKMITYIKIVKEEVVVPGTKEIRIVKKKVSTRINFVDLMVKVIDKISGIKIKSIEDELQKK